MDVARTLYEKQNGSEEPDNNALPKEDTENGRAKAEIPQENTEENTDERIDVSKSDNELNDMDIVVDVYDYVDTTVRTEIYNPPATEYPISEEPLVEISRCDTENDYDHDEVILDPDNFEYFKGVSRKKFRSYGFGPNFANL